MSCQQPKTIGETSATCNLLSSNVYFLNKLNMRSACLRSEFQGVHFQGVHFRGLHFQGLYFLSISRHPKKVKTSATRKLFSWSF